jgi:hypothetical protein
MKKFFAILALALLAVSGTGYAVTCAYDNVPAATLLVPYFRVTLNGINGPSQIPTPTAPPATDTFVSITNVSATGVIAHVTVWNKYSRAVLDFNVPLTGKDVAFWSMRDVMNGKLNVNPLTQVTPTKDVCGVNLGNNTYSPVVGWGATTYIRFTHPEGGTPGSDAYTSISQYAADAFAAFRGRVWDSLDESGDITQFTSSKGGNILDGDNPVCTVPSSVSFNGDNLITGTLSGYLTIDVVNFCTNYFPSDAQTYTEDAIATTGWSQAGYTPNVLMGDVFYLDNAANAGNISGDPAVAIEFDSRLGYNTGARTFYGKFVEKNAAACAGAEILAGGCQTFASAAGFRFSGDGREPLGDHYGFRYLADTTQQFQTWALVWRSDRYTNSATSTLQTDLCTWLAGGGASGYGLYDADHQISGTVYDNDENYYTQPGTGGPSGGGQSNPNNLYIFLESQRISLLNATDLNPALYKGGWIDMTLRSQTANPANLPWNQGWIGVQHTAPGAYLSVGHAATNLNNQFQCAPAIAFGNGNTP